MAHPSAARSEGSTPVVQVRGITVAFGGLLALRGIDLDIAQGERLAIIGPNGAGKTTLFNVIAGDVTPTAGSVVIRGVECVHRPSRYRPRLGVARTYQKARALAGLTVRENICLALAGRRGRHRALWRSSADRRMSDEAAGVADRVWLSGRLDAVAGELAHGQQRQLELGMAIATRPDVMLLDEPASGLSRGERERLVELIESFDERLTLVLIEHDMDVAFRVAQRVVVMADGGQVTAGTPEQIRSDPHVHQIYLGTEAPA